MMCMLLLQEILRGVHQHETWFTECIVLTTRRKLQSMHATMEQGQQHYLVCFVEMLDIDI